MLLNLALLLAPVVSICGQTVDADLTKGLVVHWQADVGDKDSVPNGHGGLQGMSFFPGAIGTQAFRFPTAHRSAVLMARMLPVGIRPGKPLISDQTRSFFRAFTAADRPWLLIVAIWFCALVVGEPVWRGLAFSAGIAITLWLANQGLGDHFYFYPNALDTIWSKLLPLGTVWAVWRLWLWRVVFPGRKRWGLPLRPLVLRWLAMLGGALLSCLGAFPIGALVGLLCEIPSFYLWLVGKNENWGSWLSMLFIGMGGSFLGAMGGAVAHQLGAPVGIKVAVLTLVFASLATALVFVAVASCAQDYLR